MDNFKVAIDGPAGSGKSSISKLVALKKGFIHIDTGAMYRALTIEALNRKVDLKDELAYGFIHEVDIKYKDGKIFLNGKDVSEEIRLPYVTNNVSEVAKIKAVRENMKVLQRKIAQEGKIIMDGRDIGYNVLPDADLKVFLVASVDERARRRQLENEKRGISSDYVQIKEEIIKRDYEDSNREVSPLRKATDAIVIDTTYLSIDQVVDKIIELINGRMK